LVEHISIMDDGEDEGLVAITQPLLIQETPIKAAQIVLLSRNKELLETQILRVHPTIIKGFHRHL
jgi:hypothetical protein